MEIYEGKISTYCRSKGISLPKTRVASAEHILLGADFQMLKVLYPRWLSFFSNRKREEKGPRTIINVQNQQLLALSQRMNDVNIQLVSHLFDLADVALVIFVLCNSSWIIVKVYVEIVDHVR